jgi:hypothetical protein
MLDLTPILTPRQIVRAAGYPERLTISQDRGKTRREYVAECLMITHLDYNDSDATPTHRDNLLRGALAEVNTYIAQKKLNQEAYTMTTTPITNAQPAKPPAPQPRPPIPATVPESKSPALVAVENVRQDVKTVYAAANNTQRAIETIGQKLDQHQADSAKGYAELRSEIAVIRGMVESIAEVVTTLQGDVNAVILRRIDRTPADLREAERDNNAPRGKSDVHMCSIHNCEMTRHEKDGHTWYSHKAPNDSWCRGKAKK